MIEDLIARIATELVQVAADPLAIVVWIVGTAITAVVVWRLELL